MAGMRTSTASRTVAAKLTAAPAKNKSKANVVRAFPNLSPKDVVEKAKAEGVKFDVRYVYRVRAMDKTARKSKRATVKATPTSVAVNGAAPSAALPPTSSSAEDLLRAVAAELGLSRAVEILQGERARVHSILRG
jgi:uroporphyrinogen-III synthase